MSKSSFFCSASALAAMLALGAAGQAQAQAAQAAAQQGATEVGEVVVTGSFIRGTPEDAALPVDVINADDIEKQGSPNTVELIKSMSVSSGVLGDTNQFDTRAQGSEGSGSVNLRGLGAARTLVLLNGRRMSPNPFGQAGAGIVDTNTLPIAAIGRLEVLKEGAAATYGSDAIGGVVNFITRTNVDGAEVSGSYRFIDGSDGEWDATLLWGKVWDGGNVLFSAGYQHKSELQVIDRDWAVRPFTDNPEGGWSAGSSVSAFIPIFQTGTGAWTPAAGFALDSGCTPLGGVAQGGALPACNFHYTEYDNLVEEENRYQIYAEANADLSENTRLHVEALYAFTDVPNWKTSPSYLSLQTPTATTNPTVGTLPGAVLAGWFVPAANPGLVAYRAANPTQIPAFATGVHFPGVRYRPLSFGGNPLFGNEPAASEGLRQYEAWRVSASLRGDLGFAGIGYDVAATYGQEVGRRTGYDTVVSRLQLALRGYGTLATDPNGCNATETAGFTTNAGNTAIGCHWFNPFSNGVQTNAVTGQTNPGFSSALVNNPEMIRWIFPQVSTEQEARVFVLDAVLNGQTGLTLGGGELAWAAGVQWRKDGFESSYSDLNNISATPCIDTPVTGTTSCAVRNGPLVFLGTGEEQQLERDVYAVFGELSVPFTEAIQLQLAIRYENYGEDIGSTTNPKANLRWQINDMLALRASAGTTFRGPPLTSLTNSSVTGLSFIAGAFRAIDFFGNPNLEPETANTYSAGAIFDLGGLRATIDYWRFDFENPIVGEPSASIVNTMFPAGATTRCGLPEYAALQSRFTFQGACSTATIARVRTQVVNGPAIKTSGIDVLANYDFGDVWGGNLRAGLSATYTIEYKIDAFTVEGVVVERAFDAAGFLNYQLSATSLPQLKGQAFVEYETGPHNLRATVNFIDSYIDQRTSIFAPNAVSGTINPRGAKIDDTWLVELDYRVQLPWETTATFSIDNLFDQDPSFARLDLNYDPFTGNALGRTYKVSVRKRF